jgi:septal ring factor EnvC (AmiA/AmiB activator)
MDKKIKNNNCILQEISSQVKSIKTDINTIKNDLSIIKEKIKDKEQDEIFTNDDIKPNENSSWFFS